MYLHPGGQDVIPVRAVLGIFDLDRTSLAKDTRLFLETAQKEARVRAVGEELPVSFILCQDGGPAEVVLSPIGVKTLARRMENAF